MIVSVARLVVAVLLTTKVVDVDACYWRNCPVGGKRAVDDAFLASNDGLQIQPHDVSHAIL